MKRVLAYGLIPAAVFVAGLVLGQQKYPNLPEPPVKFENGRVTVQEMTFEPGEWAGDHTHAGNQLVVIVEPIKMLYREGGEETERSFAAGDVFWVDKVEHDHKALTQGRAVLVTVK